MGKSYQATLFNLFSKSSGNSIFDISQTICEEKSQNILEEKNVFVLKSYAKP